MPVGIRTSVLGVREIADVIRGLEPKVFRPAAKKGVEDATRLVLAEARARIPVRTGVSRKALGRKVVALKSGAGYVGVVGARRDARGVKALRIAADLKSGRRKRAPTKFRRTVKFNGGLVTVDPAKILHLIEYGRRRVTVKTKKVLAGGGVVWGRSTAAYPGSGFLRASWAAAEARAKAALVARLKAARAAAGGR